MHIIQYFGDIHRPMTAHASLDEALAALIRFGKRAADGFYDDTPDPEDDRIIIWEAIPGETCNVVWHFSGWHWRHDAADLPGGPLEQGKLPGFDKSLYDIATEE